MVETDYWFTTVGALKLLHVIFGAFSLGLIADTFVPVWDEIAFVCIVSGVTLISFLLLLAFLKWEPLRRSKISGRIDFVYHILGAILLTLAGIDFSTWEDYFEVCQQDCPSLYTKGVAKILTFVNGVLYGIVAFMLVKEDELTKEEEMTESDLDDFVDRPLLVIQAGSSKRVHRHHPGVHRYTNYRTISP